MNNPAPSLSLREQIVEHARRLFATQGYEATSIRQLVEACNCTKPALYHYFASKQELLKKVVEQEYGYLQAMIARTTEPGEAKGSVRDRVHQSLSEFLDYAAQSPDALALLYRVEFRPEPGMPDFDLPGVRAVHLAQIEKLLSEGQAKGELRADIRADEAAVALAGAVNLHIQQWQSGAEVVPERVFRIVDLVFKGIQR